MSQKKTTAILVGLAALAALFGFAAKAKADDKDDDGGKKWTGPDPGLPGKKTKPKTDPNRPSYVDPEDLWVSPNCDDLILGERWFPDTATPAIKIWVDTGYGAPFWEFEDKRKGVEQGLGQVVRGILTPYASKCVDEFPWDDIYELEHPKPEWLPPDGSELEQWNDRRMAIFDAYEANHKKFYQLVGDLQELVLQIWNEKHG